MNLKWTSLRAGLSAGLTQVLAADGDTYLYGLDRIGESGVSAWVYHLPDALGSVRQLTDPDADLTATQSYEPFGSLLSDQGQATSSYGFAGEWEDATGLVHLRARYHSPEIGRFFQVDPWEGIFEEPGTLNPYTYALNNPILHTDPSGVKIACKDIISPLRSIFKSLSLCDPKADQTPTLLTLEDIEAQNTYAIPFTTKCGAGNTSYGLFCVPMIVGFNTDSECLTPPRKGFQIEASTLARTFRAYGELGGGML